MNYLSLKGPFSSLTVHRVRVILNPGWLLRPFSESEIELEVPGGAEMALSVASVLKKENKPSPWFLSATGPPSGPETNTAPSL